MSPGAEFPNRIRMKMCGTLPIPATIPIDKYDMINGVLERLEFCTHLLNIGNIVALVGGADTPAGMTHVYITQQHTTPYVVTPYGVIAVDISRRMQEDIARRLRNG